MNGKKAKLMRKLAAQYKQKGFDFDYRVDASKPNSTKVLKRVYKSLPSDLKHKFEKMLEQQYYQVRQSVIQKKQFTSVSNN